MKIVKFKDGRYAIRKWFFGYQYLNLNDVVRWVNRDYKWFHNCLTDDIERIMRFTEPIDYGTPIDTDEESFWNKIKNNKKKLTSFQDKVSIKLTELDEAIEEREQ